MEKGALRGVGRKKKKPTRTTLTAGSGVYKPPLGCTYFRFRGTAGGGGGGSATSAASNLGVAAGGGSAGYSEKLFTRLKPSYPYTVGTGGPGGADSGVNNGSSGTDTTFGEGNELITIKAGGGGSAMGSGTALAVREPNAGGVVGTGADINLPGTAGHPGIRMSGTVGSSGHGGDTPFYGGGGRGRIDNGTPGVGRAPGGGGGGAYAQGGGANAAVAGADGAAGQIDIEEFYD